MNLYFVMARGAEGDDLDCFISAPSPTDAHNLFADWLWDQWEHDNPEEVRATIYRVDASAKASVLKWHKDVVQVFDPSGFPTSPHFVVSSFRKQTAINATTFEQALKEASQGVDFGVLVWRQTGDFTFVFDLASRIAVASLVNQRVEPSFAAALVYQDMVCALPDNDGLVPDPPLGMMWQTDRVFLEDGSSWTVFADNDVCQTVSTRLDVTGYAVRGRIQGRPAKLPIAVRNAITSDLPECRPC